VKLPESVDVAESVEYFRSRVRMGNCRQERMADRLSVRPFPGYLLDLLNEQPKSSYDVLDVGAGPVTTLGTLAEPPVSIVAVDALAGPYNSMLREEGKEPIVQTRFGLFETLDLQFGAGSFDLVYSENSIDHCNDPRRALQTMAYILRPGRWAFVEAYECEAQGSPTNDPLHCWNVLVHESRVVFTDRLGNGFFAADAFGAVEERYEYLNNGRGLRRVVRFRLRKI